jgi:hypothetical protein
MKVMRSDRAKFDLDEFLARPLLAHVATASEEGPRDSPLWFLWEEQSLWLIAEIGYNTFQERIDRDPRVAVGIVDFDPRAGTLQHVGIRGTARVEPWNEGRAARMLARYYWKLEGYRGADVASFGTQKVTGRFPMSFVQVRPETVVLRDTGYRDHVLRQYDTAR